MEKHYFNHPIPFTFLGFTFNWLVDMGAHESIKVVKNKIEEESLFSWLETKYPNDVDFSLFTREQLLQIEKHFYQLTQMDERKKMGITKNGICLLVGYCFNSAQTKLENFNPLLTEVYRY